MQVLSLFGQVIKMPYLLFVLFKYVLYLLPVIFYMSLALMLSAITRKKRDCDRGIPAADVRQPDGGAAARRNQL